MTDMATTFRPDVEGSRQTTPVAPATGSTETQTLISEQQVLFSTAAAVALPPAKTRRWSDTVGAALRAMFFAESQKSAPRRHYPKRHVWLDNALMSREMDRL
jgi:hypothetical protein